jgi:hypothetical protein
MFDVHIAISSDWILPSDGFKPRAMALVALCVMVAVLFLQFFLLPVELVVATTQRVLQAGLGTRVCQSFALALLLRDVAGHLFSQTDFLGRDGVCLLRLAALVRSELLRAWVVVRLAHGARCGVTGHG